jgi:eukaryotic-like serine/threonine-protein kinase
MGEVYRARDTRLDRVVAIKILPDHLSDRAALRERFEREARTVASLNHPHICTLFDIGRQDGTDFLVMEYLEGETLAERLKKGPLPLDQVLQYAIEIADALDKAHRKGITHRDLKPGNIMLTKSGTKLLDFGLAKLKQEVAPANVQLSQLPTANDPLTAKGTIVGTLQYMAPEQLEGKEVDARTDIFAFGVVVYEMATGKKAFEGKSQASVIGAILKDDPPPISSLQPMTPPQLDRVVKKCLAKEPEKRWQAASDICDELKWIADEAAPRTTTAPAPVASGRKSWLKIALWSGAALAACIVLGLAVWMLKPSAAKPVSRFAISLSPDHRLAIYQARTSIAISPDGTHVVYVASVLGSPGLLPTQLYLRAMDGLEARPIPGTEGGISPFFSPDSQWIGFSAGGELKKVSLTGGVPVSLGVSTPPPFGGGASWSSRGIIAFTTGQGGAIQQISDAGGSLEALARLEKGENAAVFPEFLPDGKALLFTINLPGAAGKVAVQPPAGGYRDLIQPGDRSLYAASGHLVYTSQGAGISQPTQGENLLAVAFDAQRLEVTGAAVPLIQGVLPGQFSLSSTGTLIYVPGSVRSQLKLVWVDRNGMEQPVNAPPHNYVLPKVSPDGKRVAAGIEEGDSQIWVIGRDALTRLTFEGNSNVDPVWTPDGKRIVFKGTGNRLFWQAADGSGVAEALTSSALSTNNVPGSWSPDGQDLAFTQDYPPIRNIWILPLKDRKPQRFVQSPSYETAPRFSPDGHWIAYDSRESGRDEIYIRPYPGPGGKWQVSPEGGTEPVWNPKGRELFYRAGNKMMAVAVTTEPTFSAAKPKMLFEGPYVPTPRSFPDYDVSPDGQHFLMLKPSEQALAQINVVLNWFEELKQKVPVGKK